MGGLSSSCGGNPTSIFNEEGLDSQQGTLESTDGHYTTSAFASKGKCNNQRHMTKNKFEKCNTSLFLSDS